MFNLKLSLKFTPKTAIELNGIISHTHKHDFFLNTRPNFSLNSNDCDKHFYNFTINSPLVKRKKTK
jgi:hypothetical protein